MDTTLLTDTDIATLRQWLAPDDTREPYDNFILTVARWNGQWTITLSGTEIPSGVTGTSPSLTLALADAQSKF
jgi:hypothetical protein